MAFLKWMIGSFSLTTLLTTGFAVSASASAGGFQERGSCVQSACNYAGGCSFESDLHEFAEACRDVDARCLHTICNHRGCNRHGEILETIRSCKDVSADCLEQACSHGHCSFSLDVATVTGVCRVAPVDGGCLRTLCSHAGDCDFLGAFTEHVKACRGEWP